MVFVRKNNKYTNNILVKETKKENIIRIGTWNRTLLTPGKIMEVANEVWKYKLHLKALQEIR